MNIFIAAFNVSIFLVAAIVLAVELPYWTYRAICGIRVYLRYRDARLVTCPETNKPAVVELPARSMGLRAVWDEPCMRLKDCSRWPMRQGCGQDCLRQIEPRSPEVTFAAATRAS